MPQGTLWSPKTEGGDPAPERAWSRTPFPSPFSFAAFFVFLLRRLAWYFFWFVSRISIRLLALNLLVMLLPFAGLFYLQAYERDLLQAQERSMVQQGRLLAAALTAHGDLSAASAQEILRGLGRRTLARLRVVDSQGRLLADSSRFGPLLETPPRQDGVLEQDNPLLPRGSWLYRLGAGIYSVYARLVRPPQLAPEAEKFYSDEGPLLGQEVLDALQGRYGASWRVTPGQRSVTLFSCLPVRSQGHVMGAVLVSQSTYRVLLDLYEVRIAVFKLVLISGTFALALTLLVALPIARPLRRLRDEAQGIVDTQGRLKGRFRGSKALDEIGELSRALEQLSARFEEHQRFIDSFAADVSHEFKNPLASIRTATEMLSETQNPKERQMFLSIVQNEVARMERLLTSVREITRIDAQLECELRQAVTLNELLADLMQAFRLRGLESVELRLDAPQEPVAVEASPERLVQVFENVLDNALSFSPQGSTVRIGLRRENGFAAVRVSDQGPGVPEEHLDRIFDRFFSYRPDERSQQDHSGLGLAIAKAIVSGYGGVIRAENRPQGGAVFEIRLKAA